MNTKDTLTPEIYSLSQKDLYNYIETNGINELWGAGFIEIEGIEYELTNEQQDEVDRIVKELEREKLVEQMEFEMDCIKYNEVGF
jgi:hypothetical protein